jgi:hypothetical protein
MARIAHARSWSDRLGSSVVNVGMDTFESEARLTIRELLLLVFHTIKGEEQKTLFQEFALSSCLSSLPPAS